MGLRASAAHALGLILVCSASPVGDSPPPPSNVPENHARQGSSTLETGVASYYGARFHGRQTASGEVFNMHQLTAAHPRLAFGTRVRVTSLANNRTVVVRVNDRGPFVKGRIIDISQAAAEELQMIQSGLASVKLELLK